MQEAKTWREVWRKREEGHRRSAFNICAQEAAAARRKKTGGSGKNTFKGDLELLLFYPQGT